MSFGLVQGNRYVFFVPGINRGVSWRAFEIGMG